jgi:Uma2 family endonuclease
VTWPPVRSPGTALTLGERDIRPLTADEVLRMVDAGILGEDERVELLRGVLTEVSPKSPAHGLIAARLIEWLTVGARAGGYRVLVGHPLVVPDPTSLPEPDIVVVDRSFDLRTHPRTALFAIEVAVSSRRTDMTIKRELYGAAGVPEYWVVGVQDRLLHAYRLPGADGPSMELVIGRREAVKPEPIDVEPLDFGQLFAGL